MKNTKRNKRKTFCFSEEHRKKISMALMGERNGMWKGDKIGPTSWLHQWIKARKPKPKLCECCKKEPPRDLANISQKYKRDVNDYEWLCRRCHMIKDGRMKNLKQFKDLKKYNKWKKRVKKRRQRNAF